MELAELVPSSSLLAITDSRSLSKPEPFPNDYHRSMSKLKRATKFQARKLLRYTVVIAIRFPYSRVHYIIIVTNYSLVVIYSHYAYQRSVTVGSLSPIPLEWRVHESIIPFLLSSLPLFPLFLFFSFSDLTHSHSQFTNTQIFSFYQL
ncbi:hypothetical protein VNO78_04876 [Psophocarpus tetragonolobus]|uniref:Uncharacterized protein n=1 Tax=Psophocarpus tetragonolobus TaxID=3891 RepID=A0AAN9XXY2_PSOTE